MVSAFTKTLTLKRTDIHMYLEYHIAVPTRRPNCSYLPMYRPVKTRR